LYPKHSALFAFRVVSPVRSISSQGALSTMPVQSVGLSQRRELSVFSVDASGSQIEQLRTMNWHFVGLDLGQSQDFTAVTVLSA
jgi:hypothetical protein